MAETWQYKILSLGDPLGVGQYADDPSGHNAFV
jgi:hypothetical protein